MQPITASSCGITGRSSIVLAHDSDDRPTWVGDPTGRRFRPRHRDVSSLSGGEFGPRVMIDPRPRRLLPPVHQLLVSCLWPRGHTERYTGSVACTPAPPGAGSARRPCLRGLRGRIRMADDTGSGTAGRRRRRGIAMGAALGGCALVAVSTTPAAAHGQGGGRDTRYVSLGDLSHGGPSHPDAGGRELRPLRSQLPLDRGWPELQGDRVQGRELQRSDDREHVEGAGHQRPAAERAATGTPIW